MIKILEGIIVYKNFRVKDIADILNVNPEMVKRSIHS